jgi:hypothetical protein
LPLLLGRLRRRRRRGQHRLRRLPRALLLGSRPGRCRSLAAAACIAAAVVAVALAIAAAAGILTLIL